MLSLALSHEGVRGINMVCLFSFEPLILFVTGRRQGVVVLGILTAEWLETGTITVALGFPPVP